MKKIHMILFPLLIMLFLLSCSQTREAERKHGNAMPLAEDQVLYSFPSPNLNRVNWRNIIAPQEILVRLRNETIRIPGDRGWCEMEYGGYSSEHPDKTRLHDYLKVDRDTGEMEQFDSTVVGAACSGSCLQRSRPSLCVMPKKEAWLLPSPSRLRLP